MPNYSGIWTEQAVMQAVGAGNWPGNPGAPTIGTATGGNASASVTFTAPTNNGGSAITSYTVTSSPGGVTGTGASSPVTVSGLTNGTAYTFTVTATNATGTGPASAASNSVTPALPNYIEDVFSTYLWIGNGTLSIPIVNGIDLAGKGGMVWMKGRNTLNQNYLYDTVRGVSSGLVSNTTNAAADYQALSAFNSNGFTDSFGFTSSETAVSWTFRKQPKFFDVVTYTGNGTAGRTVAHNLGSTPGCIIVKRTSGDNSWAVYHTSLGNTKYLQLNATATSTTASFWNNTTPTSTDFTVGSQGIVNGSGDTYVAYLFAHNAGGFGLTGTDNVISCGTFTTDGSGNADINLGYEPQWVLFKRTDSGQNWLIFDNMRGFPAAVSSGPNAQALNPNITATESGYGQVGPTATGWGTAQGQFSASATYIYIAIRRGPMKVPTSGTSVFAPVVSSVSSGTQITAGFPVDLQIYRYRAGVTDNFVVDRLRGVATTPTVTTSPVLYTDLTDAETSLSGSARNWNNTGFAMPSGFGGVSDIFWNFARAPSFFDEVCYKGTKPTVQTVTHNLGVVPELIIVKNRTLAGNWVAWNTTIFAANSANSLFLNSTVSAQADNAYFNSTAPTSTVFTVGTDNDVNAQNEQLVAYLFATCAGVSKVGSYTGTGALQTINCGFTGGARFVLIKRTDSTGAWYVWDSARGITGGNDPYLLLNSTAAEVTSTNYVDTTAVGFQVTAAAPAGLNASGGTYIFLAIA